MSPAWARLAWHAVPLILLLAWFVLLIGGFFLGGMLHLILLAAAGTFGLQLWSDRGT